MEVDFRALQVIAEVALGIVGFSAILIALSRAKDGFSALIILEFNSLHIQLLVQCFVP